MGKHESIKDESSLEPTASPAPAIEAHPAPKMALAGVEMKQIAMPFEAPTTDSCALNSNKIELPRIEAAKIGTAPVEAPKLEIASLEAPHLAPHIDELKPPPAWNARGAIAGDSVTHDASPGGPADGADRRGSRFALLAASLALAAAFGGMIGALAAYSFARPVPLPAIAGRTGIEEFQALKENVVQARVELAALKVSIDAGNRAANAQFTKAGERIDRIERMQAEPLSKLNKAIETLDRLSRANAAANPDVTGSIVPPPAATQANAGIVEGWVVRDVHRGTALLEGRTGLIEVDKGDVVPGLGRVDAIRKQDGRWVVVTSKGLIMPAR